MTHHEPLGFFAFYIVQTIRSYVKYLPKSVCQAIFVSTLHSDHAEACSKVRLLQARYIFGPAQEKKLPKPKQFGKGNENHSPTALCQRAAAASKKRHETTCCVQRKSERGDSQYAYAH